MQQISIPDLHKLQAMNARYLIMLGYQPDLIADSARPAIEGKAVDYCQVLTGTNRVLVHGSLSAFLESGARVPLCLDHDSTTEYASTDNGLILVDAKDGLLFRVDLDQTTNPPALAGVIQSKKRDAVSVSIDILESETHVCAGKEIEFITRANIREISLVKAGKSPHAFAFITDAATQPAPTANTKSLDHTLSSAIFRMRKVTASIANAGAQTSGPIATQPDRYEPRQIGVSANGRRIYE